MVILIPYTSFQALLQLKGQFLIYSYGWSSAELGPYMTLMGVCRALVLVVLLPREWKIIHPSSAMVLTVLH